MLRTDGGVYVNNRDQQIVTYLKRFRVLSRDQLASLVAQENSNPPAIVNRIAKRLAREGHVIPVPRSRDKTFLYVNNPPMIHTQSSKINHYLGLADIFLQLGQPEHFTIEFRLSDSYTPDAYTKVGDHLVIIEYQRSYISNAKMQDKINKFVDHYKLHGARRLWIYTDIDFNVKVPAGFIVEQRKMTPTL